MLPEISKVKIVITNYHTLGRRRRLCRCPRPHRRWATAAASRAAVRSVMSRHLLDLGERDRAARCSSRRNFQAVFELSFLRF
jgi:hypothetical protein